MAKKLARGEDSPVRQLSEALRDAVAVHEYNRVHKIKNNYILIDKKGRKAGIYNQGNLVEEFVPVFGRDVGDNDYPLYKTSYSLRNRLGFNNTPAGIFTVSRTEGYPLNKPTHPQYGNAFRFTNEQGVLSNFSFHPPASKDREQRYASKTSNDNRASAGCVSSERYITDRLLKEKKFNVGDKIYVLPEERGNYMSYNPQDSSITTVFSDENLKRYKAPIVLSPGDTVYARPNYTGVGMKPNKEKKEEKQKKSYFDYISNMLR